ncbi:MAG TPA: hypothetical protein VF139_05350 [Candidatus Polarisedimenticolaceae bacterium]
MTCPRPRRVVALALVAASGWIGAFAEEPRSPEARALARILAESPYFAPPPIPQAAKRAADWHVLVHLDGTGKVRGKPLLRATARSSSDFERAAVLRRTSPPSWWIVLLDTRGVPVFWTSGTSTERILAERFHDDAEGTIRGRMVATRAPVLLARLPALPRHRVEVWEVTAGGAVDVVASEKVGRRVPTPPAASVRRP